MRSEQLYLADIVDAVDDIEKFLAERSREEFLSDHLLQSAVLYKLGTIGEAASRLSAEFKERHSEIEWRRVIAFRNMDFHAYFSMQWTIV